MIARTLLLRTACTDPYVNLAREELLLKAVQPGECILYLWQNRRAVVVGRNQDCWKECDVEALEAEGGCLARRLSGGGAVYHDLGNLNFTFLLCREEYCVERQLSVLTRACRLLGLRAEPAGRNDLTVDGRKVSGSAFYTSGGHRYHHGTLLLQTRLDDMARYLNVSQDKLESKGVRSVRARVANLSEFSPGLTTDRMCEALTEAFGTVYGSQPQPLPACRLDEDAVQARAAWYASDEWRLSVRRPSALSLSTRFDWGGLQLYADVQAGRLTGVRVYSDAMEWDLVSRLPQLLEGVRFSARAMADAICAADGERSAEIAAYFLEAVVPSRLESSGR